MHIVVVCGSNRAGSLSRTLSKLYEREYRQLVDSVDLLDMAELPTSALADDAYKNPDQAIGKLVARFCAADGVHFVVPEYNGSLPGVLKLFIDMLPYPEGLDSRPCAFTGLAAGQFQGLRAVEHTQQIVGYRNAHIFPRRLFIGSSFQRFHPETSELLEPELEDRLVAQAKGFRDFIQWLRQPSQQ